MLYGRLHNRFLGPGRLVHQSHGGVRLKPAGGNLRWVPAIFPVLVPSSRIEAILISWHG